MSVETIARRYSSALADVVLKTGEAEAVRSELRSWEMLIASNEQLGEVLSNPAIPHLNKEGILEQIIVKAKPGRTTGNFLRVLLRNNRLRDLSEIIKRFEAELQERSGNAVAKVTAARELSDGEKANLVASLATTTGKNVKPEYIVDPNIIGGIITQIGSTVYDGAVRTQLENLREELVNG
mgnify:CR=1 FL=1